MEGIPRGRVTYRVSCDSWDSQDNETIAEAVEFWETEWEQYVVTSWLSFYVRVRNNLLVLFSNSGNFGGLSSESKYLSRYQNFFLIQFISSFFMSVLVKNIVFDNFHID